MAVWYREDIDQFIKAGGSIQKVDQFLREGGRIESRSKQTSEYKPDASTDWGIYSEDLTEEFEEYLSDSEEWGGTWDEKYVGVGGRCPSLDFYDNYDRSDDWD